MSTQNVHDQLEAHDRVYLEKLRLAATVILDLGEDDQTIPDTFQTELYLFRDRVERALLLRDDAVPGLLPWRRTAPNSGTTPRDAA